MSGGSYRTPFTPSPGTSTTAPDVTPEEGKGELWTFFWLAILNTTIIGVTGVAVWWFVHR